MPHRTDMLNTGAPHRRRFGVWCSLVMDGGTVLAHCRGLTARSAHRRARRKVTALQNRLR